jgi:hypothetical protein
MLMTLREQARSHKGSLVDRRFSVGASLLAKNDDAVFQDSVPLARMPTGSPARAFAGLGLSAAFGIVAGLVCLGRRFRGLFAQLIDSRQVALAHRIDKTLERQISYPHQTKVTILTVQQTPGHRLV